MRNKFKFHPLLLIYNRESIYFPKVSDVKIREEIFVGPQIRKVIHDEVFVQKLNTEELAAWNSFKSVVLAITEMKIIPYLSKNC
jgi:hypothetical protein